MSEPMVAVHLSEMRMHRTSKDEQPIAYGPGLVTIPASVAEQWGVIGEPVKETAKPQPTKKASEKWQHQQ